MGYMRHHAIVVTDSGYGHWINNARAQAKLLGCQVTGIVEGAMNGHKTICVVPDGSKEGWGDSDLGDERRESFIDWLNAQRYDDGSSPLSWVEVQFGDDERKTRIVNHSDQARHRKLPFPDSAQEDT